MLNILDTQKLTRQFKNYNITRSFINAELAGIFGTETLRDMQEIIALYDIYENGVAYEAEGGKGDYIPSTHRYKTIRSLIDKEARFLFSIPPTINIMGEDKNISNNQLLVQKVLETNHFSSKLVRAARDCLIGRRMAIAVDFNDKGINLSFMPALEFIYETDATDSDIMTKFIRFYTVLENDEKDQQRVYKKKWELKDGYVYITEELYDGHGILVETLMEETKTEFAEIPVQVVINDGLIGDPFGKSDIEPLIEDEKWYSKLSSKDFDSLRKGTDQITYAIDINPKSTKNLSRAAGSFWDLSSDPAGDKSQGKVGTLDNNMSYSSALDTSLKRLRQSMFSQLDIPDTSSEALQGIISSGKTMKAIYWSLMVRCDEKLLDWKPAFEKMIRCIITGSKLYPDAKKIYIDGELTEDYSVDIQNSYPILEDENEEKITDINQVNSNVMSKKAYLMKWNDLTDEQAEKELKQIAKEKALFEQDNYFGDDNGVF